MVTAELINYIQDSLKQGKTTEEIKEVLRQQGGWTEQDLLEAFALPSKNSGLFLKILIPIVLIVLGVGGYFLYKTNVFQQFVFKNEIAVPQSPAPQAEIASSTEKLTTNNQASETLIVSEKDCGRSEPPEDTSGINNFEDAALLYKNDSAMKCLGESALKCENAKLVYRTEERYSILHGFDSPTLQIISKNEACYFRITQTEQKYNECPLSLVKKVNETKPDWVDLETSDRANPIKYALQIAAYSTDGLFYDLLGNQLSNTTVSYYELKFRNLGCTGNLFTSMLLDYKKNGI